MSLAHRRCRLHQEAEVRRDPRGADRGQPEAGRHRRRAVDREAGLHRRRGRRGADRRVEQGPAAGGRREGRGAGEGRDMVGVTETAVPNDLQLAAAVGGYYANPLAFVLGCFPWGQPGTALEKFPGPDEWQRQELKEIGAQVRFRAFNGVDPVSPIRRADPSGHGLGKSALTVAFFEVLGAVEACGAEQRAGHERTQAEVVPRWQRDAARKR
jgi:hypothetical protein